MTSESVRQAAARPDMNHRDPAFVAMVHDVKSRLVNLYDGTADWSAYLLGGSGTAAVEAMLTSCTGRGTTLVIENGYYSERLAEILAAHSMPHEAMRFDWLQPIDLNALEARLKLGGLEAIVCTHHETTVGRLNPVKQISSLCQVYGVSCLVDAMSSFGADPLDFENIDAVCSSANKCLHGLPGVSFVMTSPTMAQVIPQSPKRSFYLSLSLYIGDEPPLTAPVPAMAAFQQALIEHPSLEIRQSRYLELNARIREALIRLGFGFAIDEEGSSCSLICASIPAGWASDDWLKANLVAGYELYGCKRHLKERFFQVATMGELKDDHVAGWIAALGALL